jgi:signal peptidase I
MTDLPPPDDEAPQPEPDQPSEQKKRSALIEVPILLLIAFALAVIIKTFFLQAFYIPSGSMEPTLLIGDRVLVNKIVYHIHPPRRGDIIVFIEQHGAQHKGFWGHLRSVLFEGLGVTRPTDTDFIKRVIALPGETITVSKGKVTIAEPNGAHFALKEPYVTKEPDMSSYGPFTVPKNDYFVMGDNRPHSADSRTLLGPIKRHDIVGRAFIKIWPLGRFGFLTRPKYPHLRALVPLIFIPVRRRRRSGAGAILRA